MILIPATSREVLPRVREDVGVIIPTCIERSETIIAESATTQWPELSLEIWCHILSFVLRSPLAPANDDDLLESMTVFSSEARSTTIDRRSEHTMSVLRLVCRTWNEIVREMGHHIVFCDIVCKDIDGNFESELIIPSNGVLQRAQRLQSSATFVVGSRAWDDGPPVTTVKLDPNLNLGLLQTFIAKFDIPGVLLTGILERAPSVTALSWRFSAHYSRLYLKRKQSYHIQSLIEQESTCRQLTHLELDVSWVGLYEIRRTIEFNSLHYLALHIMGTNQEVNAQGAIRLSTWASFPALRSLYLSASLPESFRRDLNTFLSQHRKTLTSLLLEIKWFTTLDALAMQNYVPTTITDNLWKALPSLEYFGPGIESLSRDPPPPVLRRRPLNILLEYPPIEQCQERISLKERFCSFFQTCRDWNTREAILLETWKEAGASLWKLGSQPGEVAYLPRYQLFYTLLNNHGIRIIDRDRTPVTDPEGVQFLTKVSLYGPKFPA